MATAALALLLVPAIWFIRTDFLLYSADWPRLVERLTLRGLVVLSLAVGLRLVRASQTRPQYERAVFGVASAVAAFVLIINVLRPFASGLPLRGPMLNIFVLYAALPNRPTLQCLPPAVLSLGLAVLRLVWLTDGTVSDVAGDVLALTVLNAAGILVVGRRAALEHRVNVGLTAERSARAASERAQAELRTLQGIIPICAHCKKVRTEVGDWEQIERYVADRSSAAFSHGICPDCLEAHFPAVEPAIYH